MSKYQIWQAIRNEFKKRDAQYISDLIDLDKKHADYIKQLQTLYTSDLKKRDQAHTELNSQYRNDLKLNDEKHADNLKREQAKF